jgi:hypothetical protein
MRVRSPRILVAGASVLVLLAGSSTALASIAPGPEPPSTNGSSIVAGIGPVPDCRPPAWLDYRLQAAADYLGVSVEQLRNEFQCCASFAELATEHGKSVDGLEQVVIGAASAELDQSVAAGQITAEQEQHVLGQLRSQIEHGLPRRCREHVGPPARVEPPVHPVGLPATA